jgi:hypothetical protein
MEQEQQSVTEPSLDPQAETTRRYPTDDLHRADRQVETCRLEARIATDKVRAARTKLAAVLSAFINPADVP